MGTELRIRTGIPDEIGGESVVFANVFERDERPGGLSVLVLHDETQTVIAPGDAFVLGAVRLRLLSIEAEGRGYAVVVEVIAPDPSPPRPLPESQAYPIPSIPLPQLLTLLKTLTPDILSELGAPAAVVEGWGTESRSSTTVEWTGEEIGPITDTRHIARFAPSATDLAAELTVSDIRYSPDELFRQELTGHWQAGPRRAGIFLRAEGTAPMTSIHSSPANAAIIARIAAAISAPQG